MAFFNELGKKIGNAAEVAAEKTKHAAGAAAEKTKDLTDKAKDSMEISKLNNSIVAEYKLIQQVYQEIGELLYPIEKDNPNSPCRDACIRVSASMLKIEELQAKIEAIRAEEEPRPAESEEAPVEAAGVISCPECGIENVANSKFCRNCGKALT